jgi:hypothetical protein
VRARRESRIVRRTGAPAPIRPEPESHRLSLAPKHCLRIFSSSSFIRVMKAISDTFDSRSPVRRVAR